MHILFCEPIFGAPFLYSNKKLAQFPARDFFFTPTPVPATTQNVFVLFFVKMKIKGGKIATSQRVTRYCVIFIQKKKKKKKLTTLQGKSIPPPPLFQLSINNCIDIFDGFRLGSHLLLKRKSRQYYMADSLDSSSDSIMGAAAICVWFFFLFLNISLPS